MHIYSASSFLHCLDIIGQVMEKASGQQKCHLSHRFPSKKAGEKNTGNQLTKVNLEKRVKMV